MKSNLFFPLFCFLVAISGKTLAADITITGPTDVNSSTNFTFYATPPSPIPSGTTYSWNVYGETIVAQNTDPAAGPLFCTVRYHSYLGQSAVSIEDNNGNSGIFFVTVYGFASLDQDAAIGGKEEIIASKKERNNFPGKHTYQPLDAINWNNKLLAVA
jgi:hypothetical protein